MLNLFKNFQVEVAFTITQCMLGLEQDITDINTQAFEAVTLPTTDPTGMRSPILPFLRGTINSLVLLTFNKRLLQLYTTIDSLMC